MRFSIIQPILTTAAVVCSLSAVIQPVSVSAENSGEYQIEIVSDEIRLSGYFTL